MESILEVLKTANSITPLGVIGLLSATIYLLIKGKQQVQNLAENHLHELPELVENSRKSVDVLQRIEVELAKNFAIINERLDVK